MRELHSERVLLLSHRAPANVGRERGSSPTRLFLFLRQCIERSPVRSRHKTPRRSMAFVPMLRASSVTSLNYSFAICRPQSIPHLECQKPAFEFSALDRLHKRYSHT